MVMILTHRETLVSFLISSPPRSFMVAVLTELRGIACETLGLEVGLRPDFGTTRQS